MTRFAYTWEEFQDILLAYGPRTAPRWTPAQVWNSPYVKDVKSRFKAHKRSEQNEQCCYCQRSTHAEYSMVLDIEHILPKNVFTHCIFDLPNLAVSCKKCNMKIKGQRVDFFNSDILKFPKIDKDQLFKHKHYRFAHPNLVRCFDHLWIQFVQNGPDRIFRYRILTEIGKYTYDFFQLREFETESMNIAQGLPPVKNEVLYECIKVLEREVYD
jgi:uncharacterized protein (TIGR02646 family)